MKTQRSILVSSTVAAGLLALWTLVGLLASAPPVPVANAIVQGDPGVDVAQLVREVGGVITHDLPIINAVGAFLSPHQHLFLSREDGVRRIFTNTAVDTSAAEKSSKGSKGSRSYAHYPSRIGADLVHSEGVTGRGMTIAFVDTGFQRFSSQRKDSSGSEREVAHYDALTDREYIHSDFPMASSCCASSPNTISAGKSLAEVPEDEDAKTILRVIVELGHGLGMSVCAEGAESEETLSHLRSLRCDMARGFVIQRSLPPAALLEFVHKWNSNDDSERIAI